MRSRPNTSRTFKRRPQSPDSSEPGPGQVDLTWPDRTPCGDPIPLAAQPGRARRADFEVPSQDRWMDCTLGGVFERFTDGARSVLVLAQEEARLLNHSFIGTEHILLGLVRQGDGVGATALEDLWASPWMRCSKKWKRLLGMAGTAPSGFFAHSPREPRKSSSSHYAWRCNWVTPISGLSTSSSVSCAKAKVWRPPCWSAWEPIWV